MANGCTNLFENEFDIPDIRINIRLGDIPVFDNLISKSERFNIYLNENDEKIKIWNDVANHRQHFLVKYTDFGADCILNKDTNDVARDMYHFWNMLGIEELFFRKRKISVHSCLVKFNEKAVLFCGNSGIGKSTQGELWEKYANAEVLNGDRTILYIENNIVYASPSVINGTSGICKNETLPVKGIVVLGQSNENHIEQLSGINALTKLLENVSLGVKASEECIKICSSVPVYKFDCTPDKNAVYVLKEVLF